MQGNDTTKRITNNTHEMSRSSLYQTWANMKQRCQNPKHPEYERYGARGISVCERWQEFSPFHEDMGEPPTPLHSLDRINNDLGYSPDNCRWATKKQQSRNTRGNHLLEFNGEVLCVLEWGERLGVNPGTIRSRIRAGWSVSDALTLPVDRCANISARKTQKNRARRLAHKQLS